MNEAYPILEFDPERRAVIEPRAVHQPSASVPERGVLCFFHEVIDGLRENGTAKEVAVWESEMGRHPVYELALGDETVALFHPGVGAPLAAGLLEDLIALGCTKLVACGSAGVLDRDIAVGRLLVPTSAVRDEGTSYHYVAPSREVTAGAEAVAAVERVLKRENADYLLTKTWTTDAFYRETPRRVARRRSEGCLAVEMEAAALFAVAHFRGLSLGYILYGGDDVSGDEWDHRDWKSHGSVRERLVWLAAQACLELP